MNNNNYSYKELDVGDFFFNLDTGNYGIKISSKRYFNLDHKRVYGFYGGMSNDSNRKVYYKCSWEVW